MRVASIFLGLALLIPAAGGAESAPKEVATLEPADVVDVEIVGLRNDAGQISCVLYSDAAAFPTHPEHACGGQRVEIHDHVAHCRFENLPAGTYAVAVHHDENGNHHMDTNFIGLPIEGYGFSRDAKPHLAPPKFDDAKFDFAGGVLRLTVHIQY